MTGKKQMKQLKDFSVELTLQKKQNSIEIEANEDIWAKPSKSRTQRSTPYPLRFVIYCKKK